MIISLLQISFSPQLLLRADKVPLGDLLEPLLGRLVVDGAADTLGGAEDLPDHAGEVDGVGPGPHDSVTRGRG